MRALCGRMPSFTQIRDSRLQDAAQTGAEMLVTVCHYCCQTFAAEEKRYDFSVTNYVNLVAEAIGIHRDDKFRQYLIWGDIDLILKMQKIILQDHLSKRSG